MFATPVALAPALLAAVDGGAFDKSLPKIASALAGRPIAFERIETHFASGRPSLIVEGLRVGGPDWDLRAPMLKAKRASLTLRWAGLLSRDRAVRTAELIEPEARLVQVAKDKANWKSGKDKGDPLAGVERLSIVRGRLSLDDRVRDMKVSGDFAHDPDPANLMPLSILGQGVRRGGGVLLAARGGRLNGRAKGAAYPFAAAVIDGATEVEAKGHTVAPLSLKGFDLWVTARGPNLGVMDYLIGVGLPNSAAYRIEGRIVRAGETTRATGVRAQIGQSDFTGSIVSDGSKNRRLFTIDLRSKTLHARDILVLLASRPSHRLARSVSGEITSRRSGPLLSSAPMDMSRFRSRDSTLKLSAERFVIGGMAPGRLAASGRLDHGVFDLRPVTVRFTSGRFDGGMGLDVNGKSPAFRFNGRLKEDRLGVLIPGFATSLNGAGDLRLSVAGAGPSWRAIGRNARGRAALIVRGGDIQKSKARFLSGAMLQGALTALTNKDARAPLNCAVAELEIGGGRIASRRTLLVSGSGVAQIDGAVDLGAETIAATVHGRPTRKPLISINRPVLIEGPMLDPVVRLGGKDTPAPAAEPPHPAETEKHAYCAALTAEAAGFTPG